MALGEDENIRNSSDDIYKKLLEKNIEVLYDDRTGMSAGEKFADSDLIGIPYRIVVSKRSLADGGFEVKKRAEANGKIVSSDELINLLIASI